MRSCKNIILLYFLYGFYNRILKIKNKLGIASGSASPFQRKIQGVQLGLGVKRSGGSKELGESDYCISKLHTK
jgi:hypothetical protein